jgi:hypothetical protein
VYTSRIPTKEATYQIGSYKFYVSVETGLPVKWVVFRARNPVFAAHTDFWEFEYKTFEPLGAENLVDVGEWQEAVS